MKYMLYNENKPIKTVSGQVLTAAELKGRRFFAPLFNERHLLLVDDAGVMRTFAPLGGVAADLGVALEGFTSDEEVETAINEAYEARKEASRIAAEQRAAKREAEKATIESLQAENAELKARIEVQDEAILELAGIISETGV